MQFGHPLVSDKPSVVLCSDGFKATITGYTDFILFKIKLGI